jgi:hypothetical protein
VRNGAEPFRPAGTFRQKKRLAGILQAWVSRNTPI